MYNGEFYFEDKNFKLIKEDTLQEGKQLLIKGQIHHTFFQIMG